MATDEILVGRLRNTMLAQNVQWDEKKMFGGNCFMVDGKMCFGTYKGGLMVRVDPNDMDSLKNRRGAGQMIHGGRPMRGYLFVDPNGYSNDEDLGFWVMTCLEFNPKAKASTKRKIKPITKA